MPGTRAKSGGNARRWSATIAIRLSRKLTAVAIGRAGGRRSCGDLRPEKDLISEIVEAMDEVGRGALACLLVEKSLSEFLEGNRLAQHMEHSNQDLMRDGHGGAQRAPTGLQPVVLVLVVAALLAGGADGSLNEGRLEVNVALAGCRVLLFPGTLVIAGADPGPCSQAL